jgi:hypothetical protein
MKHLLCSQLSQRKPGWPELHGTVKSDGGVKKGFQGLGQTALIFTYYIFTYCECKSDPSHTLCDLFERMRDK